MKAAIQNPQLGKGKNVGVVTQARCVKGFTLLEFIVVIVVISILAGILINRVWYYQERAEKAVMEQVAGTLQSALLLQYAQLITRGQESEFKNLINENPMNWLLRAPPNYLGELNSLTSSVLTPGNWVFELSTKELVYVPKNTEHFSAASDGVKWVRYRTRLEYNEVRGVANKNKTAQEISGMLLVPTEPYRWFVGEEN
jgi:prepilin-type N-terminal cleavage/methylation domain-containing protein